MSLQRWYTLKVLLSQKKKPQIHKKVTFKRNEEQGIYVLSNCCPFKNENTGVFQTFAWKSDEDQTGSQEWGNGSIFVSFISPLKLSLIEGPLRHRLSYQINKETKIKRTVTRIAKDGEDLHVLQLKR